MYFNRPALKREASQLVLRAKPSVLLVSLVYTALSVLLLSLVHTELDHYYELMQSGEYEYALEYLQRINPSPRWLINIVLYIMSDIVGAGYIIFLLNTARASGACFGNLLDGFGFFGKIIALNLLEGLFIGLWSLLLIVPGIIAQYRYSMAIYLLCDHPEMSPLECIRESKRLMSGHKAELFVLDLSFLGWALLEVIPILGYFVQIWTVPYINMTRALYYEFITGGARTPDGVDYVDRSDGSCQY